MYTVLLSPGVNSIAVKYISYHLAHSNKLLLTLFKAADP